MKKVDDSDYETLIVELDYTKDPSRASALQKAKHEFSSRKKLGWELDPDDIDSIRFEAMISDQLFPMNPKFSVRFRRSKH